MKRVVRNTVGIALIAVLLLSMVGCMSHEHIVGSGAQTGYTESDIQWYLFLGLIPLNEVDTAQMAGGADNYKIVTETSLIGALLSGVTSGIITARTVKVIK